MAEEEREDIISEVEEEATSETVVDEEVIDAGSADAETAGAEIGDDEPADEGPADNGPAEEEVCEDEIACLEAKLADAEQKMAEYLDGWQRSQATFANFRRRTEAEQVSFRSVANAALLTRLLSVADDFNRAFQALPEEFEGHPWLGGISLIQRKVDGILEAENVQPIELEPGDAFDPLYHQAILYQEVEGFEDGQIVAEVERGYILSERVLRPSSVVVAKAPPKPPEPEPAIDVEGKVVKETTVVEENVEPACEEACCEGQSDECCCSDKA